MNTPVSALSRSMTAATPGRESISVMSRSKPTVRVRTASGYVGRRLLQEESRSHPVKEALLRDVAQCPRGLPAVLAGLGDPARDETGNERRGERRPAPLR